MNQRKARQALRTAARALTAIRAEWWIDCGTLLGAIRSGDFISHDTDIDLCCWQPERHGEIRAAMLAAGFTYLRDHGTPELGYQQAFRFGSVKLDIFYFYEGTVDVDSGRPVEAPGLCWQGSWDDDVLIVSEFPRAPVSRTRPANLLSVTVQVPRSPVAMLEERYGPDWRIPDPRWSWRTDPRCIIGRFRVPPAPLDDVTFVIKTFMRPKVLLQAVESIRKHYGATPVVVVDDSADDELRGSLEPLGVKYLKLPYDSGLSAGRNAGALLVETTYTVMLDDDMIVGPRSRVSDMIRLLGSCDLVCGSMIQDGRLVKWEGTYSLLPGRVLKLVQRHGVCRMTADGIRFARVDFGLNIIAARTAFLREHRWDDRLKVREHTDYFLRLKTAGGRVLFAPDSIFEHHPVRTAAYKAMRGRREFRLLFFHKHDLRCFVAISGRRDEWTSKDQDRLEALLESEGAETGAPKVPVT